MLLDVLLANISTVLVFLVVFLLAWSLLRRPGNLPPGPWPLPLVGNLLNMAGDPHIVHENLREKYGDVYTLYLGKHPTVFVHSYQKVKEVLVTRGEDFIDRPSSFQLVKKTQGKGIVFTSGKVWQEQRRFAMQALRDFGFGKPELQAKIQEEVEVLVNRISDMEGEPFDIHHLIHVSVSNVICSVVFGKRFEHDDLDFKRYVDHLNENFKLMKLASLGALLPFTKYLPGDPTKMRKLDENIKVLREFIGSMVKAHRDSFDPDNRRDFIDAYLKEMAERQKHDPSTTLCEEQLGMVIGDLFAAGTESTSTTIRWAILLLLKHPDIQVKVRREIDSVVGSRLPTLRDRQRLPFTEATIMEILRYTDIAVAGHAAVRDLSFHGYVIPKGVAVMPCFHCALHDKETWDDPSSFCPSRFLDESNQIRKPDNFIPFSAGKRICLGESLAKMEIFLFFTAIVQRFELSLPDGAEVDLTPDVGITRSPLPYKLIAKLRQ